MDCFQPWMDFTQGLNQAEPLSQSIVVHEPGRRHLKEVALVVEKCDGADRAMRYVICACSVRSA